MQDISYYYLATEQDELMHAADVAAQATERGHLLGAWLRGRDDLCRARCHRCLLWIFADTDEGPVRHYGGPAYWEMCDVEPTLLIDWALPGEEGTWD